MVHLTIKRTPKITLASALRHEDDDFFGYCLACHCSRIIPREDIIAMNLPGHTRVDQLEAWYRCTRCGAHAITLQISKRSLPGSRI